MTQPSPDSPWNHRFRAWFRRHWLLDTAWRVTVFVVGAILMLLGVLMMVLPGPGWATVALGLLVLASEYVWAQRLLQPLRSRLRAARLKAQQPQYRNHVRAVSAALLVICGVAIGAYVWRYGLSMEGVRGLWPL